MRKYFNAIKGILATEKEKKLLKFFKESSISNGSGKEQVLIEFIPVYSNILALHYFLKAFRTMSNASYVSYIIKPKKPWFGVINNKYLKLFKFMGVNRFIFAHSSEVSTDEVDNYYNSLKLNIKTKHELEMLEFDGVWVGDIIYDSYLMKKTSPTVELDSLLLKEEICEAIAYYLFWKNYFDKNKIAAVLVSHTVYSHFTVICRLAVKNGIKAYQVNDSSLYQLSKERTHAYVEFRDLKKVFNKLTPEIQAKGIEWAKERFRLKFEGNVGVDMRYSKKSAWGGWDENLNIIKPSEKIKVFVALHCFFDSPHSYGLNLFPDFYEWLDFLGQVSLKTDYEWYVKTHPDFLPANVGIVESFVKKYPKFTLLPSDTSHHYIIKSGINFLLSVYGTVGSEYAYFGIPVINASTNNPHIAFSFNLNPKSLEEYEDCLMNLGKSDFKIDKEEVFQFYFMRFYVYKQSWLWGSYDEMLAAIGGANNLGGDNIIGYFFQKNLNDLEDKSLMIVKKFLTDDTYCIEYDKDTLKL